MNKKLYSLLCCPLCKKDLKIVKNKLICKYCKKRFPIHEGIPDFTMIIHDKSLKLSQKKWNKVYNVNSKKHIDKQSDYPKTESFKSILSQIKKHFSFKRNLFYLEIGCGTFNFGQALGKMGLYVIGIDLSFRALKLADDSFKKAGIKNYLLVCGNILNLPFKTDSFHLIVGFGVIEHFKNTLDSIKELNHVLKPKGIAYNAVPYLNLGTLTYRQIWGNIPRLPILENVYAYMHINILKAKHMRFGYELSFTRSYLEKIHYQAGFSKVITGQFHCPLIFEYLPFNCLRQLATYIAKNSPLFWPMIYVAAKK